MWESRLILVIGLCFLISFMCPFFCSIIIFVSFHSYDIFCLQNQICVILLRQRTIDTLMVLCLSISLQGWIYISRLNRSDQAMTGFSMFHVGNWNHSGTGLSATKDLSFGTLFPLISNSHLPCPPLNPDWKHFCSRSPIHYAEITVTDVTGHTTMIKTI